MALAVLALLGCTEAQGPNLRGPSYFRIAVDGQDAVIAAAQAGCGDSGLIVAAASLASAIPDADVLQIHLHDLSRPATYSLGAVSTGRFARTHFLGPAGQSYATDSAAPGRLTVIGLDFTDSLIAGRFEFRLVSLINPGTGYDLTGSFRLPLGVIATVQHPEGTPCQAPPN